MAIPPAYGVSNFLELTDTPANYTGSALLGVRVNAAENALEFAAVSAGNNLQQAYDAATTPPQITLNGTPDPLSIEASVAGTIFELASQAPDVIMSVDDLGIDFGPAARRLQRMNWIDSTGRFGTELWPDDFTISTATGVNMAFYTLAARTITLNIPGGGGVGNDTAPGGMNFSHTARFEDTGFLFAAQLLINAAVQVECATNTVGPLYLFLDQYNTYADGGSRTCTQHNTIRAQPRWGPNINGGSITQTSAILFLAAMTVDATVGSASITTAICYQVSGVTLTAGGTIGTYTGLDIVNISGPSTIRGINSAMASGTFIRHTGVAVSEFAGDIHMNNGVSLVLGTAGGNRVELLRSAAGVARMIGVGGTNNEGLDWDMDTAVANNIELTSSTGAGLQINLVEVAVGTSATGGANNWQWLFGFGAKTITLGGDFARVLFSASASITVDAALSNAFTYTINDPALTIGTGSVVNAGNVLIQTAPSVGTNRYGLLITSNPSGGTLNYAFRQSNASALARFDGRLDINRGIALGGGAVATLGTIGGSGPTAAAQAQWVEIDIGGVAHWIPVWT